MHFDYFGPAMLTIFMAMIGGWVDPMSFAYDVAGLASVIFFVLVVVVPPHTSPYLPISPRGEMMQFFFPQMIDQDSSLLVPMLASVGTQAV